MSPVPAPSATFPHPIDLQNRAFRTMVAPAMDAEFNGPSQPVALADQPVAVGCYRSVIDAHQHALVILAMGLPCWLVPAGGAFDLLAEPGHQPLIARELAEYDAEEARPVPEEPVMPWFDPVRELTFLWVLVLLGVFLLQAREPSIVDAGANSSRLLIDGGEWWRPFTAMFLHSDLIHLAGNLVFGSVFVLLAARLLGPLRAWPLIFLSGLLANIITAFWHHPDPFQAIGASTAVFGALGLVTGAGILQHHTIRQRMISLLVPVAGGLALFGWLGLGGPDVDVLGHAAGFACGVVFGSLAAGLPLLSGLHSGQSRRMRSVSSE